VRLDLKPYRQLYSQAKKAEIDNPDSAHIFQDVIGLLGQINIFMYISIRVKSPVFARGWLALSI
jgi:hypothetical protein